MTALSPLTVVVPAYNRAQTLAATVQSVLGCGTPAEVVVVDDGSADGTAGVAEAFGPPVVVVRQANAGPAAARNTGARAATGTYLAFLDSDDRWRPGVVGDAVAALDARPDLDAVFCETLVGSAAGGYRPLSESTGRGRFADMLADRLGPDLRAVDPGRLLDFMLDRNQVFLGSAVFRRAVFDRVGGFDPGLFGGEDYGFCLRAAAVARWAFLARPLAEYEKHPGGLSADPDRMAREFARAVASFLAFDAPLPPTVKRAAAARLGELRFGYAYRAFEAGDLPEARRRLWAAVRTPAGRTRAAAYLLAAYLPGWVVRRARRLTAAVR